MENGSPKIDTEAVRQAAKLVTQLYAAPGGGVGGNFHIVTDDWNLETDHVQFCIDETANKTRAPTDDRSDPALLEIETRLGALLIGMSEAERASALALEAGYFEVPN